MSIDRNSFSVRGTRIEVVRKDIKNLHVGVYPPEGRVRVAAPHNIDDEAVRLAVVTRMGWIRRRQAEFLAQERQSEREYVTGECHYFQGRKYRLDVIEHESPPEIRVTSSRTLTMFVRPQMGTDRREVLLNEWYRARLKEQLPALLATWEPRVGVDVRDIRVRRMRTRWGTCNAGAGRIWLNLELAKKPVACLEYILVHEMIHFLERNHNEAFRKQMDRLLPDWQQRRRELNRVPLAHEDWAY